MASTESTKCDLFVKGKKNKTKQVVTILCKMAKKSDRNEKQFDISCNTDLERSVSA